MNIHTLRTIAGLACAGLATLTHAADWSDTSVSYRYGTAFSEPAIDKDVAKHIVAFTHVSGYKYGSNFLNLDILKSDENDPANNSTDGAQELYLVYQHQLSLARTMGVKVEAGPLRDFSFQIGFDANSKNTTFAPRVRKLILGPTAKFGLWEGWGDLGLWYYKEKNHNGVVGKAVDFEGTYRIGGAWGIPFSLGPAALNFNGWFTYTGSKGKDGFGAETKPETWLNAFLMLDVGAFAGKKGTVLAGVGYEYVRNKFGNDADALPGCNTSTGMLKAEWHF